MLRPLYIAHASGIAARMLGGEMMIMSPRDSTLFTLNQTASAIWQAADGATPLEEIVETRICAEYEVERDAALCDARDLVEQLAAHGVLLISEVPIG
jgi:hypothetical protein